MNYMRSFFAVLSVLLFLSAPVFAGEHKNIAYGVLDRQKLDIYTFDDARDAPVMVFIHGGGWRIGNKSRVQTKPEAFNDAGYVFVSAGYPLLPDHPVEQQAESVARVLAWVHANIERYGGDPRRIYIMGHSAGAHLAGLIATDGSYLDAVRLSPKILNAVVSVDGATMNVPWRMDTLNEFGRQGRRLFTNAFGEDEKRWENLSPYHHAKKGQYIPPFLFLTAAERPASNIAAEGFMERLKGIGVRTQRVKVADRDHGTINRKMGEEGDAAFAAILEFLQ